MFAKRWPLFPLVILIIGLSLGLSQGLIAFSGEAAAPSELTCHVSGSVQVDYNKLHPHRVVTVQVGPNCEVSVLPRELSEEEFQNLGRPRPQEDIYQEETPTTRRDPGANGD